MAKYKINGKEVTEEEFNKQVLNGVVGIIDISEPFFAQKELEKVKSACLNTKQYLGIEDVTKIMRAESEEELEDILKRNMNIGAQTNLSNTKLAEWQVKSNWNPTNTGGTVFEKVQNTTTNEGQIKLLSELAEKINREQNKAYNFLHRPRPNYLEDGLFSQVENKIGKKESKTVEKAPIFTYCKQMKNAVEALALRSLYGHKKYEKGNDWENFSRVENGEFEYSNAEFRHALEIGNDEDKEQHLVAGAWNAVARLELYLRNKNK